MSVITMPTALYVTRQDMGLKRFDLNLSGGDTGASQARVLAPMRWTCSLIGGSNMSALMAADWRAMIMDLDGKVNQLAIYDKLNIAPQGTARGTWTANAAAAAGDQTLVIAMGAGQAGTTIKRGDWIGVNQSTTNRQLLHVAADATANGSGVITVTFKPALRVAVASASSIVWDKPTALFRQTGDSTGWSSKAINQGDFSLELMESWEG